MIQTETNTNRLVTIVLPNELQTKHKQQNQPKAKQQQDQQQLETKLINNFKQNIAQLETLNSARASWKSVCFKQNRVCFEQKRKGNKEKRKAFKRA